MPDEIEHFCGWGRQAVTSYMFFIYKYFFLVTSFKERYTIINQEYSVIQDQENICIFNCIVSCTVIEIMPPKKIRTTRLAVYILMTIVKFSMLHLNIVTAF